MKKTRQTRKTSKTPYSSKKIADRVTRARNNGWRELDLSRCEVQDSDLRKLLGEPGVENIQRLNLNDNQLSTLPPEIGQLTALTNLNLKDNQLSSLPPEVGKLTTLTTLILTSNRLSTLPSEIGQLTALFVLDLDGNQLSTLPPEIGQLTALTNFPLSDNQLSSLPPEVGQLTTLMSLTLMSNQLSTLPPEIGQLTALLVLDLDDNQLSTLPPEVCQLTALTTLYLNSNQLSTLPPEIGQLATLTTLILNDNQLSTLPSVLIQFTALTKLDLSKNQLSALPPEVGQLTALTHLDLSNNQLSTLPPEVGRLTSLEKLYLHFNDGLGIPPEILGEVRRDKTPAVPADILDYYFRTNGATDRRPLNEVKVILVGQGSVGKTSLVKRIVYDTFNKREKKTEGIYIEKTWSVPGKNKGKKVQVNFWDFGGQEIMHATHQFFLTKRTVYLLVLDARKGENESNIHYWLKIIRSFGGDAPVLIVTNKSDTHHLDLNETRLQKDYPSIRGFFKTSCDNGVGIKQLKAGIEKQIRSPAMRHIFDPLPKAYFTVKQDLEEMAQARNYIDIRDYYTLCHDNGVRERDQQDRLLRFLHDLGSVLSFTDPDSPLPLREMSVLNPHWVTQGVYKILNDDALADAGGVLSKSDLSRILKGRAHPAHCHPFIMGMMHKFELCFTVSDDHKWLVAELLPKKEPTKLGEWADALRFEYHYDVLPGGIICRFIVRRYENLTTPPVYWRSGSVLQFDGCKALVRSDTDKGRMHIAVIGPEGGRRAFLSVLRDEFARIHSTIPNLLPQQMVPLPDNPDIVVSYEHLLTLEQQQVRDFIPPGTNKRYAVTELIDGIEDPWLRDFGESHLYPPLFVIEPQTSFADAWEVFCCDVLNRYEKTDKIYQRTPPEGGVDLYWAEKKIAYQCKSVEESSGKFSVTKAEKSLRSALLTREKLPWVKYVLCSNVALTGHQEQQLRDICPEIELLTPRFWIPRCREQSRTLGSRFHTTLRETHGSTQDEDRTHFRPSPDGLGRRHSKRTEALWAFEGNEPVLPTNRQQSHGPGGRRGNCYWRRDGPREA
ncbi:MAG: leucine-rich repeat domain-containing protein [Candidatus Hydrogenedentes bacterium]|nr:leucine-rich repeat domain-containing protein [Candidatus Hydrogenedentota bacterium]